MGKNTLPEIPLGMGSALGNNPECVVAFTSSALGRAGKGSFVHQDLRAKEVNDSLLGKLSL